MKSLSLIVFTLLFCSSIIYAQSYEYMYKKQTANDSANNYKTNNHYQSAYTDSVDTAKVIGFAIAPLYKKQPESPLGNLMADCMKLYAEKIYNKRVDAAFVNY